jgi:phage shock protein PspC (stress-responsive transcriptional regulator)
MATEIKRLYRSRDERMIGGVCGGLAKYLVIDPTVVRLIFILLALAGGPGLLIYLIMLIVVPEEPPAPPAPTA